LTSRNKRAAIRETRDNGAVGSVGVKRPALVSLWCIVIPDWPQECLVPWYVDWERCIILVLELSKQVAVAPAIGDKLIGG
jgi:hypothetical protein